MSNRTVIIVVSLLVAMGVVVFSMKDWSAKSDAITWFATIAVVVLFGLIVTYIRRKRGSE